MALSMESQDEQAIYQARYIPKQTKPSPQDAEPTNMKVVITSFPPLGQVTVSASTKVVFTASLELDPARVAEPFEVSLWHSGKQEDWQETTLQAIKFGQKQGPTVLSSGEIDVSPSERLYFRSALDIGAGIRFTLKFRAGPDQPWRWVNDSQGKGDGTVIIKPQTSTTEDEPDLKDFIGGLDPSIHYEKVHSETPNTSVWSVTTSIDGAQDPNSAFRKVRLGRPWQGQFLKWFALVRIWTPWLCPRQGREHFSLAEDAVVSSFLNDEGKHLVILAISGVDDVMTVIQSDSDGNVTLNIRNDLVAKGIARIVVALGDDFEFANAAAMYHARRVVSDYERTTGIEQKEIKTYQDEVEPQWIENWYDGLTYCTWNGLGQKLTEEKIHEAVDLLAKNQINITNLIIDDNWQSIDYQGEGQFQHGWSSFEADPKMFPGGLKKLTTTIRSKHPNIQHIAVWHALWGYWGGIDPKGQIAKDYKTVVANRVEGERRYLPLGGEVTLVAKEDVSKFYDDFYRFLSDSGVDAVKTDAQFMFDTLEHAPDRRELFNTYLDAWTISTLKHFSVKAISCMSQTPQILFHSQLPNNRPPVMVRNSDDFFPEVPSSHTWHVWTNAHNSLMTQHLNLVPDWDMFQTVHDYSGFHAAARCVSGGPIYITDVPGQHDIDLINQMTGPTIRGKTVVFRPSVMGKSLDQYVGYDDEVLLKIGTYHGSAVTGTSMIGLFNISPRSLTELLPLSRFPGIVEAQFYVIRAHASGFVTHPMQVVDPNSLISMSLGIRGYDILSAYPLRGFVTKSPGSTLWLASLGLVGKMAAPASVVSTDMTMNDKGKITVQTKLKALGVFGLYVSELENYTIDKNFLVTILGQVIPRECVGLSKQSAQVLELDVERAWKMLDLHAGWSNEVQVVVWIIPS